MTNRLSSSPSWEALLVAGNEEEGEDPRHGRRRPNSTRSSGADESSSSCCQKDDNSVGTSRKGIGGPVEEENGFNSRNNSVGGDGTPDEDDDRGGSPHRASVVRPQQPTSASSSSASASSSSASSSSSPDPSGSSPGRQQHQKDRRRRRGQPVPHHEEARRMHRIRQSIDDRIKLRNELVDHPTQIALATFLQQLAKEVVQYAWSHTTVHSFVTILALAILIGWGGTMVLSFGIKATMSWATLHVAASLVRPVLAASILIGSFLYLHPMNETILLAGDMVRLIVRDASGWFYQNLRVSHVRCLVCGSVLLPTAFEMMLLNLLIRRILAGAPSKDGSGRDNKLVMADSVTTPLDRPVIVATYAALAIVTMALCGTALHRTISALSAASGKTQIRPDALRRWRRDGYVVLTCLAGFRTAIDSCVVHGISRQSVVFLVLLAIVLLLLLSQRQSGMKRCSSSRTTGEKRQGVRGSENEDDSDDDDISRLLQRALRHALHDALRQTTDKVRSDEMLQLAMLRWVVDYWSTTTTTTPTPTGTTTATSIVHSTPAPASIASSVSTARTTESSIDWVDLRPMLSITAQQMQVEAAALSGATVDPRRPIQTLSNRPTASTTHHGPPPSPNTDTSPQTRASASNFEDLHQMLLHMNLHDDAKPAVDAWRRTVETFPPHRFTSLLVATVRRCPALLLLAMYVLGVVPAAPSTFGSSYGWVLSSVLLLPMALLDVIRTQRWSEACQRYLIPLPSTAPLGEEGRPAPQGAGSIESTNWFLLVDPMVMILVDDDPSPISPTPALLRVWYNVQGSVTALERGLVAATCVQTTAVAIDFAHHLCSLVNVGVQVSQQGWWFGVALLVQEAYLHWRAAEEARGRGDLPSRDAPPLIHSAVTVARHSKTLNRNLSRLFLGADETQNPLLSALPIDVVVGFLALIVGRGWLWAREGHEDDSTRRSPPEVVSTVVIEELDGDDDECGAAGSTSESPVDPRAAQGRRPSPTQDDADTKAKDPSCDVLLPLQPKDDQQSHVYHLKLLDQVETIPERYAAIASQSGTCAAVPFVDRLARVMELVAECAEKKLILEEEKNALCERLSASSDGCEVDQIWIDAMAVSLQGMLDHAGMIDPNVAVLGLGFDDAPDAGEVKATNIFADTKAVLNQSLDIEAKTTLSCDFIEPEQGNSGSKLIDVQDAPIVALDSGPGTSNSAQRQEADSNWNPSYDPDSFASSPRAMVGLERVERAVMGKALGDTQAAIIERTDVACHSDDLDFVPLSISPSVRSVTEDPQTCLTVQPAAVATASAPNELISSQVPPRVAVVEDVSDEDDSDYDFLPLDSSCPPLKSPMKTESIDLEQCGKDRTSGGGNDDDDNLWLKVGGGLAIVGAIVGGAAAMAMMNDNNSGSDDQKRTHNEERNRKQK